MDQAMSAVARLACILPGRSCRCLGGQTQAGPARQATLAAAARPPPESSRSARTSSPYRARQDGG